MAKIRTHYDNLKVVRDAPPEVIRAAYKTLSQKYHPDKNPGDADAARIMAMLNEAYRVLSDPALRREHDEWIARQEGAAASSTGYMFTAEQQEKLRAYARAQAAKDAQAPSPPQAAASAHAAEGEDLANRATAGLRIAAGIALILVILVVINQSRTPPDDGYAYDRTPAAGQPVTFDDLVPANADAATAAAGAGAAAAEGVAAALADGQSPDGDVGPNEPRAPWVRPVTAPNGRPWPGLSYYLNGEPQLATGGYSELTIDAGQFPSDVHAKLVRLDGTAAFPVRQVFIRGGNSFTIEGIAPGRYDVRYRDLDTGELARSEAFDMEQTEVAEGTQFSRMSMTLYRVENGNMQTHELSEQDF